jgi:hypothetical protein
VLTAQCWEELPNKLLEEGEFFSLSHISCTDTGNSITAPFTASCTTTEFTGGAGASLFQLLPVPHDLSVARVEGAEEQIDDVADMNAASSADGAHPLS